MSMPFIKSSHTKRRQAITDIIESIALEECAISHILNAEGEELQKVVCFRDLCVEDIVTVNRSLCELIKDIDVLECTLKDKLKLFENCICSDCNDDDCDRNDDD